MSLLGVISHHSRMVTFGSSKSFLRECIWSLKKTSIHIYYPCWIIHFIGCVSAKYLPLPPFPINPIPHKIKRLFFYWWKCIPIFLRLRCVYHRSIMKTPNKYPCYISILIKQKNVHKFIIHTGNMYCQSVRWSSKLPEINKLYY